MHWKLKLLCILLNKDVNILKETLASKKMKSWKFHKRKIHEYSTLFHSKFWPKMKTTTSNISWTSSMFTNSDSLTYRSPQAVIWSFYMRNAIMSAIILWMSTIVIQVDELIFRYPSFNARNSPSFNSIFETEIVNK